jgi:hypothetical protein
MVGVKSIKKRFSSWSVILLLITLLCSFSLQLNGIYCLYLKKSASRAIVKEVSKFPVDIIATDIFWLPEELTPLYFKKKIMFIDSSKSFLEFIKLLKEKKVKSFLLIRSPKFRAIRNSEVIKELLDNVTVTHMKKVQTKHVEFLEIGCISLTLKTKKEK